MNKKIHSAHQKRLLASSILLITSALSVPSFAASVCTDAQNKLVFTDTNITGSGSVWVAGYNNGSWMWSSESTCTAGQCVSEYTYSGGQVEYRLEGPGVANYYSPSASQQLHPAVEPAPCGGGNTAPNTPPSATPPPASQPSATPAPTAGGNNSQVEAENATLLGSAQTYEDSAASGNGGVAYISSEGAGFSINNAPASRSITIRYASINAGSVSVRVNGSDAGNINFSATGGWTSNYQTATANITIPANATVEILYNNGDAALNIDSVQFATTGAPATGTPISTPAPVATPTPAPNTPPANPGSASKPAIPDNGQQYFIIGQDKQSVIDYMNVSDLPKPYGITMYATLSRGEPSYDGSYCFKGLDGLKNVNNYNSNTAQGCSPGDTHRQNHWGSGEQNVQWVIETYNPEVVAIGLWCPSNDSMPSLYNGNAYDDLLTELADFFNDYSSTKFMLRTCYEFNGDAGGWSAENFRKTFQYVRTFLDGKNVKNVAHVWQSDAYHGTGRGTSAIGDQEQGYWPGKRYVDWVGVSQFDSDINEEAGIAVSEGLPLFIAEATPHGALFHQYDFSIPFNSTGRSPDGSVTLHNDLNWFNQKDDEIYMDVSKAWSYINADWSSQPQWANARDQAGQNYFKYSDSRVQVNSTIKNHFQNMVSPNNGFILGE